MDTQLKAINTYVWSVIYNMEVHNPLYLSLQPSNKHLAQGLVSLLAVNFWFRLTMITQEELRHDGFHRTFRELTEDDKWTIEDEVFISKGASPAVLNASIATLSGNTSKIFVLHATASLTRRIFITARRTLPKENRFAWIITENAYTRREDLLRDFPLGTKAFLVNHDVRPEELLKDTFDLIGRAFQEHTHEDSAASTLDAMERYRRNAADFHGLAAYSFPSSTSSSLSDSSFSPSLSSTLIPSLSIHKPTARPLSLSSSFSSLPSSSLLSPPSSSSSLSSSPAQPTSCSPLPVSLLSSRGRPKVRDCWTERAEPVPAHQDPTYW
ncbi:hypothetical protein PoB_006643400 [Plakobranchus ocellatus]|uniref:Receptor ligand binding region domain-containing protein n=1 Tax=Plakobranchus ocellatus TaxID=259542 RepID=A0AAV4D715_9GAST|nr:hypothetical protein PoB_006643400 [Plakobranchus ocellatus]